MYVKTDSLGRSEIVGDIDDNEVGWSLRSGLKKVGQGIKHAAKASFKVYTLPIRTVAALPQAQLMAASYFIPGPAGAALRAKMKEKLMMTAGDYKLLSKGLGGMAKTGLKMVDQAASGDIPDPT